MDEKIINLLIVGRTGSGKSALANVLSGTSDFVESESSVRKPINSQEKVFNWEGTNYHVADIPVGTKLTEMKILYKIIKEGICSMPEGINQVLFVVDERFTVEEIQMFKVFEKSIKKSGIVDYVTIVRTRFSNFKNKEECEKDRKALCEESKTMAKIVKSCKGGIVYVDNPPTNISPIDDDDRRRIEINEIRREKSRTILLGHLKKVCQQENCYKLKTWDKLHTELKNSQEPIESIFERHLKSEFPKLFKTKLHTKSMKDPCSIS